MRGGGTSIGVAAMAAVHARDVDAWCAWITPAVAASDATVPDARANPGPNLEPDLPALYAPALVRAHVDLDRLLVVRPPPQALARTAVKVAASGAFTLLVVDVPHPQDLGGAGVHRGGAASLRSGPAERVGAKERAALVVRKLALAAEESGTTSILLTSALAPRSVPWPVALRLEVERRPDAVAVRVVKDRSRSGFGAGSSQHVVRLAS